MRALKYNKKAKLTNSEFVLGKLEFYKSRPTRIKQVADILHDNLKKNIGYYGQVLLFFFLKRDRSTLVTGTNKTYMLQECFKVKHLPGLLN